MTRILSLTNKIMMKLAYSALFLFLSSSFSHLHAQQAQKAFAYNGKHKEWVATLLTRVPEWKTPGADGSGAKPPVVKAKACIRDTYVAAAVAYAWAAEAYARQEEDNKAAVAADKMYHELEKAEELCSDVPVLPGGKCDTEHIYRCGELKKH